MQSVRKLEIEEAAKSTVRPMTERQKYVASIKAQVEAKTYKLNTKRVARALLKALSF